MDNRILIGGGVAAVALLGGLAYFIFAGGSGGTNNTDEDIANGTCKPSEVVTVASNDFTIGKADAPVTLVEYFSQTCSHCGEFRKDVIPKLDEQFVKPGHLRIVFRELYRNNIDVAASLLGRCLGNDKFLLFTDMLLEQQQVWMAREDQNVLEGLKDMARRAGMNTEGFEACLKKDKEAKALAEKSMADARTYCIDSTPTLILNGKKLEAKHTEFNELSSLLKDTLKKAGVTVADVLPAAPAEGTPAEGTAPAEDGAPAEGATPAAAPTAPAETPAAPAEGTKPASP